MASILVTSATPLNFPEFGAPDVFVILRGGGGGGFLPVAPPLKLVKM